MKLTIAAAALLLQVAATANTMTPAHQAVLSQFKNGSEKAAKDAVWTAPTEFKVGVINNGSPRHGYAAYVCSVIEDTALKGRGVRVQIVDIAALVREKKWVTIGSSDCK